MIIALLGAVVNTPQHPLPSSCPRARSRKKLGKTTAAPIYSKGTPQGSDARTRTISGPAVAQTAGPSFDLACNPGNHGFCQTLKSKSYP